MEHKLVKKTFKNYYIECPFLPANQRLLVYVLRHVFVVHGKNHLLEKTNKSLKKQRMQN